MATSTLIEINTEADFTAAFPDAVLGSSDGRWLFDTGGSTGSGSTGPGSNNTLAFMHTETSGASDADTAGGNGIAAFADLPDQAARTLHLRVCIQGDFGDGTEGLRIQQRAAAGDPWTEAGFIYGWTFSDYTAGQPVTDENGNSLTIAADGGWIDFEVAVADDATEVRLLPVYIFQGGTFRHDIALRSYQWEWPGQAHPDASAPDIDIDPVSSVDEDAGQTLTASITGGTYDTLDYAWVIVSGGGSITGSGASVSYAPPDVASDTQVTVRVTVTARGTGITAADGTTDTDTDTEEFTVNFVQPPLPDASAPTVSIDAIAAGDEGTTVQLSATLGAGGDYDTLSYIWNVAGGTLDSQIIATPLWTRPAVAADTYYLLALLLSVRGTGTNAAAGTIDHASVGATARVNNLIPPPPPPPPPPVVVPDSPGAPARLAGVPNGDTRITLTWLYPDSSGDTQITGWEIRIIDIDGTESAWEPTGSTEQTFTVRGLVRGKRYGFRVRAVNAVGMGQPSPIIYAAAGVQVAIEIPSGYPIPLLPVNRQSVIIRLDDRDCRVTVWWQPSDASWYGSLEVPANTPVVQSHRLGRNIGLLDRIADILPGNIVLRELGDEGIEPGIDAWERPTHALVWTPN